MGGEKFVFAAAFPGTSRRQRKSFSVQQFFKNAAEVWASSPHLRSKSNCMMKRNKNLRENRKNRNCLQNQKVVMRDTVSGAIAIPRQAGDVSQPCRTGFGWYSKGNVSCETMLLGKRPVCGSILTAVYSEICGKSVIFISTNAIKIVVSVSSKLPLALQSAFKVAAADNVICPARYLFRKIASEISTTPSKLTSPQFLGYS